MGIERDCKKIHKKIRKFYEKYKNKRNICLNLKCDKENDSYNICLYVNQKIEEYNKTIEDNEAAAELVDEELTESNILVGKTDVYGEGVVVTLSDGTYSRVYASHLIDLVNELRYAGAEAISINGVRVLAMTDIVDVDTYILVNLQRIQGPYVVKAIGDKDYISTILQLKGSGFVDTVTDINVSLKVENKVEIPKYNGELEVEYMQEVVSE